MRGRNLSTQLSAPTDNFHAWSENKNKNCRAWVKGPCSFQVDFPSLHQTRSTTGTSQKEGVVITSERLSVAPNMHFVKERQYSCFTSIRLNFPTCLFIWVSGGLQWP